MVIAAPIYAIRVCEGRPPDLNECLHSVTKAEAHRVRQRSGKSAKRQDESFDYDCNCRRELGWIGWNADASFTSGDDYLKQQAETKVQG